MSTRLNMIPAGLTQRERDVMDRWDAGVAIGAIAKATGLSRQNVSSIVSHYHDAGEESAANAGVRRATKALADAIAASGGRFA